MIKNITLSYFRKHESLSLDLTKGINIFRGANEIGKSTIIEGICYCMFGTKALRDSLEFVVTSGHKKSKLKVVITVVVNEKEVICSRSASGAEVKSGDEIICTGQPNVTKFMEELFGMPGGTSHLLFVAKQNEIRGIIESGNAHEFIEKLADFDEIDSILEKVKEKYPAGSAAPIKSLVEAAESELSELTVLPKPKEPNLEDDNRTLEKLNKDASTVKEQIASQREDIEVNRKSNSQVTKLNGKVTELNSNIKVMKRELSSLITENVTNSISDLESRLQSMLEERGEVKKNLKMKSMFDSLPTVPDIWEGSLTTLDAEILAETKKKTELESREKKIAETVAVKKSNIVTEPVCFNCGHEITDYEEKNTAIQKEISDMESELTKKSESISEISEYLDTLSDIVEAQVKVACFCESYPECVVSKDVVPWKVKLSEAVAKTVKYDDSKINTARDVIAEAKAVIRSNEKIDKRREVVNKQISATEHEVATVENTLRELPELVDVSELESAVLESEVRYSDILSSLSVVGTKIQGANADYALKVEQYNSSVRTYETAKQRVVDVKEQLRQLDWNNNFLKAVRKARVEVIDQVWNMVLTGVSSYFSKLRQMKSVVTRDDKGFKCDGRPVSSLSGSTLDLLGLAFRAALTRMFIPNLGVQIWDEPAAAADADRSEVMMGFLTTLGFDQTIVVTHFVGDEVAADNLCVLGDVNE